MNDLDPKRDKIEQVPTNIDESHPRDVTSDIVSIVTKTNEQLIKSYEQLKWIGFMSASGTLVIIVTFILSAIPGVGLNFQSQILYVITGFLMLLTSAGIFALQNTYLYRLEIINRRKALKQEENRRILLLKAIEKAQDEENESIEKTPFGLPTG